MWSRWRRRSTLLARPPTLKLPKFRQFRLLPSATSVRYTPVSWKKAGGPQRPRPIVLRFPAFGLDPDGARPTPPAGPGLPVGRTTGPVDAHRCEGNPSGPPGTFCPRHTLPTPTRRGCAASIPGPPDATPIQYKTGSSRPIPADTAKPHPATCRVLAETFHNTRSATSVCRRPM